MPIAGRNKKAKPCAVRAAYWQAPTHPRPSKSESFKAFAERLKGSNDPFFEMLIEMGYGEPTQQEYLNRLDDIADLLSNVRSRLHEQWKK